MHRVRHVTLAFGLLDTGYWVRCTAFDSETRVRQLDVDRMTWRECRELLELLPDEWRPGVELLDGGIQESLF